LAPEIEQSMWQALAMSPGAWKQTSEREPQSLSWVQERQCAGLCGIQYPLVSPAVMGSQKKLVLIPQSVCWVQGWTQTGFVPMTTGLHSIELQSLSCVQSDPSGSPGLGIPPVPVEVVEEVDEVVLDVAPPEPPPPALEVVLVVLVVEEEVVVLLLVALVVLPCPPLPPEPVTSVVLAPPEAHPITQPKPAINPTVESASPWRMAPR
jgi:hypothetical protein